VTKKLVQEPKGYHAFVRLLAAHIQKAAFKSTITVNRNLILLYWRLGHEILVRQKREGWGAKIIDRLAKDLAHLNPQMQGLSTRNLKYMRAFAESWPDPAIVQASLAQLTWYHNLALMEKLRGPAERLWYARQAVEHGWSRNVLVHQIESKLHRRLGKAVTNFRRTLPAPQSELAQQLVKDPYNFDFLSMGASVQERDLERSLLLRLRDLLLELGKGFSFVGSQYHLEVGGQDYYLDLLFYHLRLRCFVVIDLKVEEFKPEYAGKMNFYLSAVDEQLRRKGDNPSIGIILCKSRNEIVVEYALRDTAKPVSVARYRLTNTLSKTLQSDLPTRKDFVRANRLLTGPARKP